MDVLILAAIVWWTFAVAVVALVASHSDITDLKDVAFSVGLAVFWPVTAALILPMIVYQAVAASASRIRTDLKNRGLLNEFEDWLRERNAGKVSPKDE